MSDDPIQVDAPRLSLARFRAIVETHGAASKRWPTDERAAMQALAAARPEARALLEDETALDACLDALAAPPPSELLVARLKSSRTRVAAPSRGRRSRHGPFAAGIALVATLGVGLALWLDEGSGHPGRAAADPIAEIMPADLALIDAGTPNEAENEPPAAQFGSDDEEPESAALDIAGLALE